MKRFWILSAIMMLLASGAVAQNMHNGHAYVDLGLSVKWATCNVGANTPEQRGDFFAWGETSPKSSYTEGNCKTWEKSIGDISGNPQYDAATANWGGNWRMPTNAEFNELRSKCTWDWTTQNGKRGYRVTGPNGNSIFLPAAGCRIGDSLHYAAGSYDGHYCSSTPNEENTLYACYLYFKSDGQWTNWVYRHGGLSVRPVLDGNSNNNFAGAKPVKEESATMIPTGSYNGHAYVDLGLSVKWATCNVGANTPEQSGDFFAWGETSPKSSYTQDNCETWEKSIGDIKGTSRDVAHVKWGGNWRMPTNAEFDELINKCTWIWTTQNGKCGYRVTGPNGNSIFLPAAGLRFYGDPLSDDGSHGYYWSSTPKEEDTQDAYYFRFINDGYKATNWHYRGYGRTVRPVIE